MNGREIAKQSGETVPASFNTGGRLLKAKFRVIPAFRELMKFGSSNGPKHERSFSTILSARGSYYCWLPRRIAHVGLLLVLTCHVSKDYSLLSRSMFIAHNFYIHHISPRGHEVIAESLSREEIAGLKEMFKMIDMDNSG